MKRIHLALALGITLLLDGCATARPPAERQVRDAMLGFLEALNALDATRMASYFSDDVTAFVPSARPERVDGRPAVVRIFETYVERTRAVTARLDLRPEAMEVEVSGDFGFVSFQVTESEPLVTRRRTFLFQRAGSAWKIRHFHASDFRQAPAID